MKNGFSNYSRIDEPLYVLDNGTLYENYEIKFIKVSNILSRKFGNNYRWAEDMNKDFFQRRGNFHGITLFDMVDSWIANNNFPSEKLNNLSDVIPNTYEV